MPRLCHSHDTAPDTNRQRCRGYPAGGRYTLFTPNKLMSLLSQTTEETLLGLINPGTCFGCEAGTVIAHIRANGDLFPCSFFRDPIFCAGNILQNSLQSIWATSEAFYPLRKITNIPEKCKDCKKNHSCFGGCRAYAYYTTGSLQNADPRCWRL